MLTALESNMGLSYTASVPLRTYVEQAEQERGGAKPLLEKIQRRGSGPGCVEAATTKHDQLHVSLQAVQDKLHAARQGVSGRPSF